MTESDYRKIENDWYWICGEDKFKLPENSFIYYQLEVRRVFGDLRKAIAKAFKKDIMRIRNIFKK